MNKNISIVTNFGCRKNCWYCIWKRHKLEKINIDTNWNKLEKFLYNNIKKGKVSVSGGGDCLYKYDKYKNWWIKLFKIIKKLNIKIDIHTREKFYNNLFWNKINRCVFSSDKLSDDKEYLKYLIKLTKIRITHLVTANTTDKIIEQYLQFQNKYKCQFTIKELVGYNDNNRYAEIKIKYSNIFYLGIGDYNLYYMPDNSITKTFL